MSGLVAIVYGAPSLSFTAVAVLFGSPGDQYGLVVGARGCGEGGTWPPPPVALASRARCRVRLRGPRRRSGTA